MKAKSILFILLWVFVSSKLFAQYGGGAGTLLKPYKIETAAHLVELAANESDWSMNYHFEFVADIDMLGTAFTPLGNTTKNFYGYVHGNNHVISNLTVTPVLNNEGLVREGTGLFGALNGLIENLGIVNVSINAASYQNSSRIGAFVGELTGGTITRCYCEGGSIDAGGGGWTGGIVGVLFNGGNKSVENCYSTCEVKAGWGQGGIVGATRGEHKIENVAFYGVVSKGPAITSVQTGSADKNGIAATNAYFKSSTGTADENATGLSDADLLDPAKYKGFDFDETWKIDADKAYAVIRAQEIIIPELDYWQTIKSEKLASDSLVKWKNFGPGMSGYCEEFWCHPNDVNTMFMSPDMYNSYGTWDNGKSWQTIKDCDGTGVDMRRLKAITFSRQNPDFAYAIDVRGYLYKSDDRGRNWTKTKELDEGRYSVMTVDPSNDDNWYIGAGNFWDVKSNHRSLDNTLGSVYQYSAYGHILKSTDKGKTWEKITEGFPSTLDVGRIIVDPRNSSNIVAATNNGVYRSTNQGASWQISADGLPNNIPRDLTSYYNATTNEFELYVLEQTVFTDLGNTVGTKGGVYKSTDGGASWSNISGNLAIDMSAISSYGEQDRFHRAVSFWFGISKDDSKAKYTQYPKATLSVFNKMVVNPLNNNEIYISHNKKHDKGFGPGDIWKTSDGGQTWIACARNGSYWLNGGDQAYWQSRQNPTGANIDFAHLQDYIDKGDESSGTRMLAINAEGEVFAGINQQTIRSNNKGEHWEQVDDYETEAGSNHWIGRGDSNLPGRFMLLETGIPQRKLLCSGEHGLWQTTGLDGWSNSDDVAVEQIEGQNNDDGAHSISTVAVDPKNPDIIYMMMWRQEHRGKFRRSTDGGKTWENISTVFEADNASWEALAMQYSLLVDPENTENIYFCSIRKPVQEVSSSNVGNLTKGDYGVYHSSDGGYTWNLKNNGLPAEGSVRRIIMHPDNSETLFACINKFGSNDPSGLYKSTNKASTWTEMSIPAEITGVNNIYIDGTTKHMFLSCGYRSGAYEGGGVYRSKDNGVTWELIFKAPYVWQCETSPVNSNIIVISVPAQIPNMINDFMNPGIYLSQNAGETWLKVNKNIGQPDRIVDIKPDPYNEEILWCAGWGSGWYKGIIQSDSIATASETINVDEKFNVKVYPNPANNYLVLETASPIFEESIVRIYSLSGKLLYSKNIADNYGGKFRINLGDYKNGMYVLHLINNSEVISRKFMVNK